MEILWNVVTFACEVILIVLGLGAILILIAQLVSRGGPKSELEIERLDQQYQRRGLRIKEAVLNEKDLKKIHKRLKKEAKAEDSGREKPVTYVLDFKGDVKASAVDSFREEVSAIVDTVTTKDEIIVRLESPGGMVHSYGLAAAQLLRLKNTGAKLTICVDKVAASGGYMMACIGSRIVASPFAIVGSIGVVAQVPNLHRFLKKHDVEYHEYTAGEYKRTISVLGEITQKGEEKFKEQLEETHVLFKNFVSENRPALDIAKIATGEHWYGRQALGLGLIDEISTSDEVLLKAALTHRVLHVKFNRKAPLSERMSGVLGRALHRGLIATTEELESRRLI